MSRISRYLARIRTFRFENLDHKEFGVCSSLSMLDPVGWLFPNLRELYINFGEMAILKPHYFTPLLTPSLRSITILGPLVNGYNEEASYAILNKLKLCNAKISDISYIKSDHQKDHGLLEPMFHCCGVMSQRRERSMQCSYRLLSDKEPDQS